MAESPELGGGELAAVPPSTLRQYGVLIRTGLISALQYRADFVMTAVGAVFYEALSLAYVGVVLHAFGTIGGWTFSAVGFIYGIRTLGHAVHGTAFGQLWSVDRVVREGEFDRYLFRPVNPLVQLLTRSFQVTAVGDLVFGIIVLSIAAAASPVDWTPWKVLYLLAAVFGSAMVESAVMLAIASLSFRLLNVAPLLGVVDTAFVTFGPYPLSVMPRAVGYLLTFLLPLAFAGFFPAAILLHRTEDVFVPVWLAAISPVTGPILLAAAVALFHRQIRYYASPGH